MVSSSSNIEGTFAFEALKVLLRKDDFLLNILSCLIKYHKSVAQDSFLTSARVLQNLIDYSTTNRTSLIQSMADTLFDLIMNEKTAEETQLIVKGCVDKTVADENVMVTTVQYFVNNFCQVHNIPFSYRSHGVLNFM